MSTQPARTIDDLDRQLIERLRDDGRESNRSLARALSVNEVTVATRLRRLESDGMLRVVALADMEAFGYHYMAFALINVAGRPALEVASDLAKVPETVSVTVAAGRFDVIAVLLARDRADLVRLAGDAIPAIDGVAASRYELAMQVLRFDSKWTLLRAIHDPPPAPSLGGPDADELDLQIIRALQRDARSSNRSIAADLNVSEGTVRSRLRRLEDERRIRIQAISDVEVFGLGAHAFLGVHVAAGQLTEARDALLGLSQVVVLAHSLGEFELFAVVVAGSREELVTMLLDTIQRTPGVRATELFESCATLKHAYTWARLLDPAR